MVQFAHVGTGNPVNLKVLANRSARAARPEAPSLS